ncbi:MAG: polysaccharide deacetylase family protein [Deltaproteobacteria bacterium]
MMKLWLGVVVAVVAGCGDNALPDFEAYDQDPYFHWDGQPMVGAYGLNELSPKALGLILDRIDHLDGRALVLYGHATAQGVSRETLDAVFARAREAGVDTVTFADLARGGKPRPGIAVTFDDTEIDAWFGFRDILASYDARATFFVTRYAEWTDDGRQELHTLYDEGNDVEAHGVNHVNICAYTAATGKGVDGYVADEVLPSLEILKADGFAPVAFAFPGGSEGNAIVDALQPLVPITRAITELPE